MTVQFAIYCHVSETFEENILEYYKVSFVYELAKTTVNLYYINMTLWEGKEFPMTYELDITD